MSTDFSEDTLVVQDSAVECQQVLTATCIAQFPHTSVHKEAVKKLGQAPRS